MDITIRNAEGHLSQGDISYASRKLEKLSRYFSKANRVELMHKDSKLGHRVEVTVFADGHIIRGEESHSSLRAAIDLVNDKLSMRVKRLKERLSDH